MYELTLKQELLKNQISTLEQQLETTKNNQTIEQKIELLKIDLIIVETDIQTLRNYPVFNTIQVIINPFFFTGILIIPFLLSVVFVVFSKILISEIMFLFGIGVLIAFMLTNLI